MKSKTARYAFRLLFSIGLLLATVTASADEYRSLTNSEGKTIEAKVLAYSPGKMVTIELRSGKKFNDVDIAFFSKADQAYFKEWQKARIAAKNDAELQSDTRLSIFIKSSRDDELNETGDPDNREVEYEPAITFDNKEIDYSFKKVEGTLVFIGESVLSNREFHILYREDFKVDLPRGERVHWKGRSFKNTYDDYAKNGSAFGAEYAGYLLVLFGKDGKAKIIKASKSSWEDDYRRILAANINQGHSRDFSDSFDKTVYRR